MKFSILKDGQTCLFIAFCVLTTACNPDEYFPIEEFLTGDDAICYEAKDLQSCQALADKCQPSYVESEDETKPLEFVLCLANPNPDAEGGTVGGTDGGSTTGGTDGSTVGGTDGGTDGSTVGGTDGGTDGSTVGGTDGGSTSGSTTGSTTNGGNNSSGTGGGTSGGDPVDPDAVPTLEDALASKCQNLSSEYLWTKTETKKGKVINVTSKVKVCHMTGNGSAHTVVIACPALKAHIKHQQQGDYLGACFQ